ncbi:MAG: acyltransferase [Halieaceae bacterium]
MFLESSVRRGTKYLYEIECFRGLAVVLVFGFHVWGISFGEQKPSPLSPLVYVAAGHTGVTLFFVLSGFLLSLPWLRWINEDSTAMPNIGTYYLARILRIMPLYLVFVIAAGFLVGDWHNALRALSFQFVGFELFPYGLVWWTLTTEVQFYLLLPFGWIAYKAGGFPRLVLLVLLVAWAGAYLFILFADVVAEWRQSYWFAKSLFGRLPAFLIGVSCAIIYCKPGGMDTFFPRDVYLSSLLAVLLLLLLGFVLSVGIQTSDWVNESEWHIHHTYEAVIWGAILLLTLLAAPVFSVLVINPAFALLGKLSYSIYLNHVPILFFVIDSSKKAMGSDSYEATMQVFYNPLIGFAVSVALASVTYYCIETPFLKLKRRLPA